MRCSKPRTWTHAIFCANFGSNVTGLRECRSLWCGGCYTSAQIPNFHISGERFGEESEDDHDRIESGWGTKKEEGNRFKVGRNGDDLLVSFECDYCVFGKLYNRLPDESAAGDVHVMACIRRILLAIPLYWFYIKVFFQNHHFILD